MKKDAGLRHCRVHPYFPMDLVARNATRKHGGEHDGSPSAF
jgi:hypothetical protein